MTNDNRASNIGNIQGGNNNIIVNSQTGDVTLNVGQTSEPKEKSKEELIEEIIRDLPKYSEAIAANDNLSVEEKIEATSMVLKVGEQLKQGNRDVNNMGINWESVAKISNISQICGAIFSLVALLK